MPETPAPEFAEVRGRVIPATGRRCRGAGAGEKI